MVTVHVQSTDQITAWRIRDVLACHPLLAGTAVEIQISATRDGVVLHGCARDARLVQTAVRLARSTAGRRVVHTCLAENRSHDLVRQSGGEPRFFSDARPGELSDQELADTR